MLPFNVMALDENFLTIIEVEWNEKVCHFSNQQFQMLLKTGKVQIKYACLLLPTYHAV